MNTAKIDPQRVAKRLEAFKNRHRAMESPRAIESKDDDKKEKKVRPQTVLHFGYFLG